MDNSDPLIAKRAGEITGNEKDPMKKAMLIRDWVRGNMKFNPGITMANSTEVIRDMEGTCVSYAMVTAALCKAAGIPSRYLMGYVYVDGAWGGHAWNEIHAEGRWLPIDSAVSSKEDIPDAARFHYFRSALQEGMGSANIGGMQLYSNVEIEILDYTIEGNRYKVNASKPYEVDSQRYFNHGLQLGMEKLYGFNFTDMDKFYPENTLFALQKGGDKFSVSYYNFENGKVCEEKARAILKQQHAVSKTQKSKFRNLDALKASSGDKSLLAIIHGIDVIVITSEGPDHGELLEQGLKNLDFKIQQSN